MHLSSRRHPVVWLLIGLVAGFLLALAPSARSKTTDWHMIMILVAENNESALRDWLARRDIAPRTIGVQLAAPLSEADVEALAERDLALLIRAPLPGESIPELSTARQWMPLVQAADAPVSP